MYSQSASVPEEPEPPSQPDEAFIDSRNEVSTDSLRKTALAADRYGVSDRATAAIVNGFQLDIGRIGSGNTQFVVDHKKVQRVRHAARESEADNRRAQQSSLTGLYFDGRKDTSFVMIGSEAGPSSRTSQIEEHIAVVAEPGGQYLTHFTPASGKAHDIFKELQSVVDEFGGDIVAIGADGTAVNTGKNGGVCRLFELFRGRPVHWFICQLHSNELNLRELFTRLDGVTTGPKSFSGPIGKKLAGQLERAPVVSFQAIPGNMPELEPEIVHDLSTDQHILYLLATGVTTGHISRELAGRKIGPLNMARWLTLAARILRLYVSTIEPSDHLRTLARFIVTHYVPIWFQIKCNPSCKNGSKNLFRSVQLLRDLPDSVQSIVRPVIERNGYWAHPEAILLAMLADPDDDVRQQAVSWILRCREEERDELRPYQLPVINFDAEHYTQLINWSQVYITEPPLTSSLSESELRSIGESMPPYPVHTQAVERAVQLVTQAASAVVGQSARHGYICVRLKHRASMPVFESKRDFRL